MGSRINFTLDSRYNMPGIKIKTNSQNSTTRAWGYGALKREAVPMTKPEI